MKKLIYVSKSHEMVLFRDLNCPFSRLVANSSKGSLRKNSKFLGEELTLSVKCEYTKKQERLLNFLSQ